MTIMAIYVIHKCAVSLDGCIDDTSSERLILSNAEDLDCLDEARAQCDAILVGAETIRRDNPSLLVRSEKRRLERRERGLLEQPAKVTLTRSGRLEPSSSFFTQGMGTKLVYCPAGVAARLRDRLGQAAEVIGVTEESFDVTQLLSDLHRRGVTRLLLEGGSGLATQLHAAGLVDELQISVAPFFVGEASATRFVQPARFVHDKNNPLRLVHVEQLGDVAVLTYRKA